MERASGEGTHGGCIFSEWRVGEEWVLQSEGCFRVGAKFQSGGCQRRCEWRVRAHTGMRDHTLTRTRGRRRTSTANATAAAYRRACQKAAYAIRISSTDSPRKLNVDVALRLSQARGGEPPPIFGMRIL